MINKDTKIYGSFSNNPGNNGCKFFNKKFQENNINAIYKSFYSNNINDITYDFGGQSGAECVLSDLPNMFFWY